MHYFATITLVVAVALGPLLLPPKLQLWAGFCLVVVLGGAVGTALLFSRIPRPQTKGLKSGVFSLMEALAAYRQEPRVLVLVVGTSVAVSLISVGTYIFTAVATGVAPSIGLGFVSAVTHFSAALPLTPSGLGVSEGAFVGLGSFGGLDPEVATATAFLYRLQMVAVGLLGGICYLAEPISWRQE